MNVPSCERRHCIQVSFIWSAAQLTAGDIRTVTAVDYPELRHLCNVIVFSVRGKPLPDQYVDALGEVNQPGCQGTT